MMRCFGIVTIGCRFARYIMTRPESIKKLSHWQVDTKRGERMVNIICGSPGSGKTTYMRKRYDDGDLVVDVAWLFSALTGQHGPIKDSRLVPYTLAMRDTLYDMLIKNNDVNAWVMAGAPKAEDRQALADKFGVEVKLINKTRKQCLEQVMKDDERKADQKFYIWLVNDWFDNYTPRDADVLV
jgi:hypothetical protein